MAAICGSYYLYKIRTAPQKNRIFVWFLWFVFFVDTAWFYTIWNYFDNYKTFPWLRNSVLVRNEWLYNLLKPITYLVYCSVFVSSFKTFLLRKWFRLAMFLYAIIALAVILFSGNLFVEYLIPNIFLGNLLLLACVGTYFLKLLNNDDILYFTKDLLFYIAIGTVVWNLCVTPIYIYNTYFSWENKEFLLFYSSVLRFCNIFMYCTFSLGFLICARSGK